MRAKKGFTLVELLVVILILGALAAIAVPRISASADNAKKKACATNVDLLNSQIELYHATEGSWPTSLKSLTDDGDYFPDGMPVCPVNAETEYEYDAKTTHRVSPHSH